jgi:hypothetical protein
VCSVANIYTFVDVKAVLNYWKEYLAQRKKGALIPESLALAIVNSLGINRRGPEITTGK